MTDYLENAVEAAKDCLGLEEDGDYELVKGALRAAEPFIAEYHRAEAEAERDRWMCRADEAVADAASAYKAEEKARADERARVVRWLTGDQAAKVFIDALGCYDGEARETLAALADALNSEADQRKKDQ